MSKRELFFGLFLFLTVTILVSPIAAFSSEDVSLEPAEPELLGTYTCTLDFTVDPYQCDCEGPVILNWVNGDENRAVMKIDMKNDWGVENVELNLNVWFNEAPSGWVMNFGNSETNNGGCGDSATFSCDSEFDIRVYPDSEYPNTLSVCPNDYGELINRPLLEVDNFFPSTNKPSTQTGSLSKASFIVKDHHMSVEFLRPTKWPINAELNSEYLFRLNHPDEEGAPDWIYWLGVNRVIQPIGGPSYSRNGGGIEKIEFTLKAYSLSPPPNPEPTDADKELNPPLL